MKLFTPLLMLILLSKCYGQQPFIFNYSPKNLAPPEVHSKHNEKTVSFKELDTIIYTLNFIPDSVITDKKNYNYAIINSPTINSETSTVNGKTDTKSTYAYIITITTSNNFTFHSPMFYINGFKHMADPLTIKVKPRELTQEEIKQIEIYNLTNKLINDDNTIQILYNKQLGYYCTRINGKFVFAKELNKRQVRKLNKIIN